MRVFFIDIFDHFIEKVETKETIIAKNVSYIGFTSFLCA